MDCGKPALFVLVFLALVLAGCDRSSQNDIVQQVQQDQNCLKRVDVRLIAATLKRSTAAMEAAIKSGADVNAAVEGLGPPIVVAALGDYKGVQLLLDSSANINAEDGEGYTALINASFTNSADIVRLLLSKGANVNASSNLTIKGKKTRITPLMIAKSQGHQEIVKLLTDAGANE
jgi:ankyrin repeat protein